MLTISVNLNSQVYKDQNKATFTNITSKKIKQEALKKEKDKVELCMFQRPDPQPYNFSMTNQKFFNELIVTLDMMQ